MTTGTTTHRLTQTNRLLEHSTQCAVLHVQVNEQLYIDVCTMENCDIFPICQLNVFCQKLQHIFLCCVLCQQQKKGEENPIHVVCLHIFHCVVLFTLYVSISFYFALLISLIHSPTLKWHRYEQSFKLMSLCHNGW